MVSDGGYPRRTESKLAMKNNRVVTGFMCKVDWDHELGIALGGNSVFATKADLIANKKCTDECGIVEVEVRLKRVIRESDFHYDKERRVEKTRRSNRPDVDCNSRQRRPSKGDLRKSSP